MMHAPATCSLDKLRRFPECVNRPYLTYIVER